MIKFAFSKPTTAEDTTVLLSSFRDIGYEGLQLKSGQYSPYLDNPGRFNEEWSARKGVASGLICGINPLAEDSCESFRRILRFGSKVRTELVIICLSGPRDGLDANAIRAIAKATSELGKEALVHGLKITVHNHYNSPLMHREDFDIFYGAVSPGTVGLTIDTAHVVKSGISDIAELIRSFGSVIDNFHLKDYSDGNWQVLGHGNIDFKPVFSAIREIGYVGWISTDEESGAGLRGTMEECLSFMKRGFAT